MRKLFIALAVAGLGTSLVTIGAQQPSPAEKSPTLVSPDKQWEYKCGEYGFGSCYPEIVKAGTTERALDLDQELNVNGPDSSDAEVMWAPDSKRFAFNYSPVHAHHTTFKTVAFSQLRGDEWVALRSPLDDASESSQLAQPLKEYLPRGFNPRHCTRNWGVLKLRKWSDANTAILYAHVMGAARGK